MPRRDVVRLHLSDREVAFTDRANAVLTFVGFGSVFLCKLANVEVAFLAVKNKAVDAQLVGHVIINQQAFYLFLRLIRIEHSGAKFIVKVAPKEQISNSLQGSMAG